MLKVDPLADEDARELVLRPIKDFPLTYDDEAVTFLLKETGYHPNWLQFACREVVENPNNEDRFHTNKKDVELALEKVPSVLAGDFKDLWEGRDSSDLLRSVLKFVASAKTDAVGESQLSKKFQKQEAGLQDVLTFLTRRDILIKENDQYYFNAALLRRWVAKQRQQADLVY